MNNFEFACPTRVVFGKGSIARLADLIEKDKKVLVIYGGGSIKQNGVYEQVMQALQGHTVLEFGGIEPNPEFETCMKAVELIKRKNVEFLLSVGGGSTLDATKFIAAAAKFEGEPWDIIDKAPGVAPPFENIMIKDALPIGDVITLPATGSEMNCGGVISRRAIGEKRAFSSNKVYPKFSIIDPESTFSLPAKQTVNGVVDTFVHVMEQYATYDVNTPLQDEWALGIIKTLIKETPKILENPNNYEARANIFWCATCGLNYWIALGAIGDWATHMIGHELTAVYGLDHGQTLAIVMPKLWDNQKAVKLGKLAKMGRDVYGCDTTDDNKAADCAIKKTEEFFNAIGQKTKLADYSIDANEAAAKVRDRFNATGTVLGEHGKINGDTVYEILKNC